MRKRSISGPQKEGSFLKTVTTLTPRRVKLLKRGGKLFKTTWVQLPHGCDATVLFCPKALVVSVTSRNWFGNVDLHTSRPDGPKLRVGTFLSDIIERAKYKRARVNRLLCVDASLASRMQKSVLPWTEFQWHWTLPPPPLDYPLLLKVKLALC